MTRARTTRGLTLLELLLAVTLLSAVVTGGGWWLRTTAVRTRETARALKHEAAGDALLAAIGRDLTHGDLAATRTDDPRVRVEGGALLIRTRTAGADGVGAVVRRYARAAADGTLRVSERGADGSRGGIPANDDVVVLGDVVAFTPVLELKQRTLTVTLTLAGEAPRTRRWGLP